MYPGPRVRPRLHGRDPDQALSRQRQVGDKGMEIFKRHRRFHPAPSLPRASPRSTSSSSSKSSFSRRSSSDAEVGMASISKQPADLRAACNRPPPLQNARAEEPRARGASATAATSSGCRSSSFSLGSYFLSSSSCSPASFSYSSVSVSCARVAGPPTEPHVAPPSSSSSYVLLPLFPLLLP